MYFRDKPSQALLTKGNKNSHPLLNPLTSREGRQIVPSPLVGEGRACPRSIYRGARGYFRNKSFFILVFIAIFFMYGNVSVLQAQTLMQGLPQVTPSNQGQLPQIPQDQIPQYLQSQLSTQQQTPKQKAPLQGAVPSEIKPAALPTQPSIETVSEFEKYISGEIALEVSTDIKQFGYDLFRQFDTTFVSADEVPIESIDAYRKQPLFYATDRLRDMAPVGPDYVIGPGDEIRITVWGKVEGQWSVVVDRDGNINLPKVGILGITGLTFMELKELLQKELSRYYTGFEMNISMGALRTIRVYVVGNAEKPGRYTISSLATLVNALFEAGGPSKIGTMRDIQVKRNGKTIVHFDMYDFLLRGDKTKDVRLMPEDVIFIPPVGMLAAVAGSVNNPAIYELKDETKITQLIEMASGLSAVAFNGRVQIERIVENNRYTVFESNIEDIRDKDITLQSGDILKVFHVVDDKRTVKLSGAVQREGEYGFKTGLTVRDLLLTAGGLKYYAYAKEAELTRVHITDQGPKTEKILINLDKAIAGEAASNINLKEDDYLFVRTVPEWQLYRTVEISGEVKYPGTYTIIKGERVSSLIERAGGFTDRAYLPGVVFTRKSVQELQQKNLNDAIDRLEQQLLSQSSIAMQTALTPEEAQQHKIVSEQQNALLAKMRAAKAQGRLVIRFELDKFKGSPYDIEVEGGDSLNIPDKPGSIQVLGSVYNATAFLYDPKVTISRYIEKAGGATKYAEYDDIFVLKVDGSAISKRQGGVFFMSSRLEPGDAIVVPEQVERIAWMREVKDITQIIFQLAVTAGVVIALF